MEISNLVVARYADGRLLKGVTQDFSPNRGIFHVHAPGDHANAVELRFKQLKALFFVKTLEGDGARPNLRGFVAAPAETQQGKKIAVRFKDGEFLCGYTLSWTPDREGFFLFPADAEGNNQRIFVITAATAEVKAGPAADVLAQRVLSAQGSGSAAGRAEGGAGGNITPLPRPGVWRPNAFLPKQPPRGTAHERPTGSD